MKHVIVIETADNQPICPRIQDRIEAHLDGVLEDNSISCAIYQRYNRSSAIAAVHEIYGAPEWKGGL